MTQTPETSDAPQGDPQEKLLEILVCPLTRSPLTRDGDELVAEVGGLRYPVRDGIPVMLVEEAALPDGAGSLDALRESLRGEGHAVYA